MMVEVSFQLTALTLALLSMLVLWIWFMVQNSRTERKYLHHQNKLLVDENRQYHQIFLQMIDQRMLAEKHEHDKR